MNRYYSDILERIQTKPIWFDENAVPRFDPFTPEAVDIYATECALLGITCQNCGERFRVALSWSQSSFDEMFIRKLGPMSKRHRTLHYGDPPNIGCCGSGPTMNSEPKKILEFWIRHEGPGPLLWDRHTELEVDIEADWAKDT